MILAGSLVLILLALLGMPLFGVIGGAALLGFQSAGIHPAAVLIEFYRMASAPTLLAIPLFTFAGYLLAKSGAPQRLLAGGFGWMPGGVAFVPGRCAGFTAFRASGADADAGGFWGEVLPRPADHIGQSRPSLRTESSLDTLRSGRPDAGGPPLPGRFLSRNPDHRGPGPLLHADRNEITPGGPAASVTAFYLLVVEVFVYKDLNLKRDLPRIIRESMILVGGILIILGTALGFTSFLIDEEIPMRLLEAVRENIDSRIAFLMILNLFLLVVGMMMDIFSAIIVVVPLITPIAREFGVHPVHLGIIFLTNLEIGYATPPVGLNLFIASYRFERPVTELYRASLPFLALLLFALLIITYWPDASLFLVRWMTQP